MARSSVIGRKAQVIVVASLWLLAPAAAGVSEPELPWVGQERIEVELKTVAFYAEDDGGQPVSDLRAEEVELRVDGRAVPFETFDAYPATSPAPQPGPRPALDKASRPAAPARQIFLLFDVAFLSPMELVTGQAMVGPLLAELAAGDQIHLLVNDPRKGLRQVAGPVPADPSGRQQILARIERLVPSSSLQLNAGAELDFVTTGKGPAPGNQVQYAIDALQSGGTGEYMAAAQHLAQGLSTLASRLAAVAGPKLLLVISGGVADKLYFEGSEGSLVQGRGGDPGFQASVRYASALMTSFARPLEDLSRSGAMPIFFNPGGVDAAGRDALRHMREDTGGLYFEGANARAVAREIAGATSALYELGFYAGQLPPGLEGGRLEVVAHRPGVRCWSASHLAPRPAIRALGTVGRQYWVVDLVRRGLEGRELPATAQAALQVLPGQTAGRASATGRRLRFEPDWTAVPAGGDLELYDVLLAVRPGAQQAELVHLETLPAPPAEGAGSLEVELPREGAIIWGIVAVDRQTGATWFRRFLLESPGGEVAASVP